MLADANGLGGDDALVAGSTLTVPEVKTSLNDASTFKPYDPGEITGPTTPSLPYLPPPNAGCGIVGQIIMVAVAALISTVTYGIGGALLSSVLSQGVGSMMGVTSFSWKNVLTETAVSAVTMGVGAGLAKVAGDAGNVFVKAASAGGGLTAAGRAVQGVAGFATGAAARKALGQSSDFSWAGLAASAVGSYASAKLGGRLPPGWGGDTQGKFGEVLVGTFIDGASHAAARQLTGFGSPDWKSIAANAIGTALGSSIGNTVNAARMGAADTAGSRGADGAAQGHGPARIFPDQQTLDDWRRLVEGEGRVYRGQSLPTVVLSSPTDVPPATTTIYSGRYVDPYLIERNGGQSDYTKVVYTYAAPDRARAPVQEIPLDPRPSTPLSRTARYGVELDRQREYAKTYFDPYRGSIGGDAFANGMTISSNFYYGLRQSANSVYGMMFDRQYGDELKDGLAFAVTNPGVVYDGAVDATSRWFELPLDAKAEQIGTLGLETALTAGLSKVRYLDTATDLTRTARIWGEGSEPQLPQGWVSATTDIDLAASEALLVRQLEPGNVRSASLPRNGDRLVLNQGQLPTCGPNSCAMDLDTAGKPFDLARLITDSKVTSNGAFLGDMAQAMRNQGLSTARISNRLSLEDLASATSRGHPAVVAMRLDRGGHAVVVDGVTVRQGIQVVAIRDPALGRQYFTPVQEFLDRFSGQAILTNPRR